MNIYETGCSEDAWGFCRLLFYLGDIAAYTGFYSAFEYVVEGELLCDLDAKISGRSCTP